jgi:undecaprenol kinase
MAVLEELLRTLSVAPVWRLDGRTIVERRTPRITLLRTLLLCNTLLRAADDTEEEEDERRKMYASIMPPSVDVIMASPAPYPRLSVSTNVAADAAIMWRRECVCFIEYSIADLTTSAYPALFASGSGMLEYRPMKRLRKSFGHALDGLIHALKIERNLQLFVPIYALVLVLGGVVGLLNWEWLALFVAGAGFMAVELLNTALERLTDVLDDQKKIMGGSRYHASMKATKDVAAAASLVSLFAVIAVIVTVFWPYADLYVLR